jgi:hypothetical protein
VVGPQNLEMKKGLRKCPKSLILMVGTTRLELATFPSETGRSNRHLLKTPADAMKTNEKGLNRIG